MELNMKTRSFFVVFFLSLSHYVAMAPSLQKENT